MKPKKKLDWSVIWKTFNKFHDVTDATYWNNQKAYFFLAINLNVRPKNRLTEFYFNKIDKAFKKRTRNYIPNWPTQRRILQEEVENVFRDRY